MNFKLDETTKRNLEKQHRQERDRRLCDRIKAVLLSSEGWSVPKIAQALRIHETSVKRHLDDFHSSKKLKPENGGSQSCLSQQQTQFLINHLTEITYQNTSEIIDYVKESLGIVFSVSGMNAWLHRQGFSYKKATGIPHKMDPDKQQRFIKKYRRLKKTADKSPILFIDAVHPTQSTRLSHGWIKTGEENPIRTTGSRTRLNIVGALDLKKIESTCVKSYKTINSEKLIDFFFHIRKQYSFNTKINLILDGASYHRSNSVKQAARKLKFKLHYLPPYSPNLNPIERLWKVMNEHARNNVYFASAKEFRQAIDHFFTHTLSIIGKSLSSRINDNFQILNPAS